MCLRSMSFWVFRKTSCQLLYTKSNEVCKNYSNFNVCNVKFINRYPANVELLRMLANGGWDLIHRLKG